MSSVCHFNPFILLPGYVKADTSQEDCGRSVSEGCRSVNTDQHLSLETEKGEIGEETGAQRSMWIARSIDRCESRNVLYHLKGPIPRTAGKLDLIADKGRGNRWSDVRGNRIDTIGLQ